MKRKIPKILSVSLALVLALSLSLVMAVPVAAEGEPDVVWVDDGFVDQAAVDLFDDTLELDVDAFDTIQEGIEAVAESGTVNVAAGTYNESVIIDTAITLSGTGYPTVEAVTGNQAVIQVTEDGVTVTGFKVTGAFKVDGEGNVVTDPENEWTGIAGAIQVDSDNNHITNNIVYGNDWVGIQLGNEQVGNTGNVISNNQVYDNVHHGIVLLKASNSNTITENTIYGNRMGIHLYDHNDGNTVSNNTIYDSFWAGIAVGSLESWNVDYRGDCNNNIIEGNEVYDTVNGHGIFLQCNSDGNIIRDNQLYRNSKNGIDILFSAKNNEVVGNNIYDNGMNGIAIDLIHFDYWTNVHSDLCTGNTIHFNNIHGNAGFGLNSEVSVDATNNWWGDASGPTHATNPLGIGDAVSDNADFCPWWDAYPEGSPLVIDIEKDWYKTSDVASITVFDDAANTEPTSQESILITAESTLTGDSTKLGLLETGVDTCVFTGKLTLVGTTPGKGELLVSHGDTITVTYIASTDTAEVDNAPPIINGLEPADESVINTDPLVISATLSDGGDSGVDTESVAITINGIDVTEDEEVTVTESSVTYTYEAGEAPEGLYEVTVDAADDVGNAAETALWSFNYDITGPAVSNQTPEPDIFISTRTPTVSCDISDPNGIDRTSIHLGIEYIGLVTPAITPTLAESTDYHVEYQVSTSEGADFVDGEEITVTITAEDLAGNPIDDPVTDEHEDQWGFTYDASAPELVGAMTGFTWEVYYEAYQGPEPNNNRTSILAIFSEPLDESTVEAADFQVAGLVTPSAVEVHELGDGVEGPYGMVFLTLTEEMDTDATPSVELVGEVSDIAGNAQTEGLVEAAEDFIDPILTVDVDPELGMDETEITITVTSSETLPDGPAVWLEDPDGNTVQLDEPIAATDTTTWEGIYTLDEANPEGVYTVVVSGVDAVLNESTVWMMDEFTGDGTKVTFTVENTPLGDVNRNGVVNADDVYAVLIDDEPTRLTVTAVDKDTGIITLSEAVTGDVIIHYAYSFGDDAEFEGDFTPPTVDTFTPADEAVISSTSPLITITFDEAVEVLEATFDEVDVLAELYSVDEIIYTLATADLEMDGHTISVLAADLAGNEMTEPAIATFTVAIPTFDIDLSPGWNLISLPLVPSPSEDSIDIVLADITDNVIQVRTWVYEDGVLTEKIWAEGGTVGALSKMVDGQGYWIQMTEAAIVTATGSELPAPPQTPPSYSVYEGWNLIGFKSLDLTTTAEAYLGPAVTLTFEAMYGYDAARGVYIRTLPAGPLKPGQGYWLAVSAAGTIYP